MNDADLFEVEESVDGRASMLRCAMVHLIHQALNASSVTPPTAGSAYSKGVVRRDSDLGTVESLEYDAYPAMAITQLRRICKDARSQWPEAQIAVEHRLGIVNLGEPSVVIAVGTPHRAEAFACCRFLIEKLKVEVPIWKKERAANKSKWVHGSGAT